MDDSQSGELVFSWGQFELHESDTEGHFLAIGTTGSGKTIILRLLMQDALSLVGKGLGYRGLVYDAKQDVYPILAGYCEIDRIKSLNPFDARGYAWWMSKDVRVSAVAMEVAFTLIPEVSESSAFFRNSARHIAWGIMCSYMLSGLDWTFADMLRSFRSMSTCRRVLLRHPQTRHVVRMYFGEKKLLNDIRATLAATLMVYEPIAGSWEKAHRDGKKLSLLDCMDSEEIVILGNSEMSRAPIDSINRCIFKRWTELILAQPDGTTKRFWTFIDELSEAGPLPSIVPLLKKSRSHGGRVAVASQSIAGLQDSKMYGEWVTKDLLAVLSNRFVGRLECPITAEYLSQYIGDQEIEQTSTSSTFSSSQNSRSVNRSRATQRTVLPSEYMAIPACGLENGLAGLFKIRSTDACFDTIEPSLLFDELLLPKADDVPDFVPRDDLDQFVHDWTKDEKERFAPKIEKSMFEKLSEMLKPKPKPNPDIPDFNP
ncbi:MAG: type IV secretion system DNA-binding domain-containing protein [Pirellulaceae bacterium]|nr:type IV secretion system DNA-binding domain-containing protein [Pirellulaceae bacterium]